MTGWSFDGGEPPDFDDLDGLQAVVVPELERLVAEAMPGTLEWTTWVILLVTVRDRLLMVKRLDYLDTKLNELAEHITDATDAGIREVIQGVKQAERDDCSTE